MSLFRNKHILVALLIAPVLAVIAWFSLEFFIGEKPQAAQPGSSYPLVELPNCRYNSGRCTLKNEDFVLKIRAEQQAGDRWRFTLLSAFELEGVKLALAKNGQDTATPVEMQAEGPAGLSWSAVQSFSDPESDRIHLVASARGTLYFGDAALNFTLPPENP